MKKEQKSRLNIWRIKSPWLRLPVAWLYVVFAITVYAALLGVSIAYGVCVGVKDGFGEWRHQSRGLAADFWRAATTVRTA